jgi:hypothetical protein
VNVADRIVSRFVTIDGSTRRLMVASLRYLDTFVKTGGTWLFSDRLLYVLGRPEDRLHNPTNPTLT